MVAMVDIGPKEENCVVRVTRPTQRTFLSIADPTGLFSENIQKCIIVAQTWDKWELLVKKKS